MLVFSHLCNPSFVTGTEKILLLMLGELKSIFSCTLVVPSEGVIAEKARSDGIPIIVLKVPLVPPEHVKDELERQKKSTAWPALISLLLRSRPDIVLVNACVNPLPAIAAKALGIPVICTIMEPIRETTYTSILLEQLEQHADWIVCISRAIAASLRTQGLTVKTTILPPSWRMEELHPAGWPANRQNLRRQLGFQDSHRVIGYIASSIDAGKGFEDYIQMAVRVAAWQPQAMFLMIGSPADPSYFESCLDIARQAGVIDRFRWIRFEENIEEIYPAMDVVVVPSLISEGFGMSALEGLVFGKAVIVYGSGGLEEIQKATGNEEFVVPTGDFEGLAERLSYLLADEGRLRAISARNSLAAERVFGIAAYRSRLQKFLKTVQLRVKVPFRLVRGSGPTVYLYEQGFLRPYVSERVFLQEGNRFEEVRSFPDDILKVIPPGKPIGAEDTARRADRRSRRKRRSKAARRAGKRGAARSRGGKAKPSARGRRVKRLHRVAME